MGAEAEQITKYSAMQQHGRLRNHQVINAVLLIKVRQQHPSVLKAPLTCQNRREPLVLVCSREPRKAGIYAGDPRTMFKNCANFTITGGAFGVTPQSRLMPSGSLFDLTLQSRSPPNFHSILMGDLNLLTEIGVERIVRIDEVRHRKTGHLVRLRPRVVGTRRIHRALVTRRGIKEILTAVVYEGLNVDEASVFLWAIDEGADVVLYQWRNQVEKHVSFRYFYFELGEIHLTNRKASVPCSVVRRRHVPGDERAHLYGR
jgi:hypothetical protein